ncbi:hypothetical protein Tco_0454944 [Tanacetum coccineum]
MSSPNRSTSDIEDAFSSINILNYTSVSSDSFPASSGSSSFNSSENSTDNMIPPVFSSFYNNPCLKDVQAFYAKESPILSPDPIASPAILTPSPILPPSLLFDPRYFFVPEELLPPKKQIHSPSSSSTTRRYLELLDELYLHRIERMEEGRINGKRTKGLKPQGFQFRLSNLKEAQKEEIQGIHKTVHLSTSMAQKELLPSFAGLERTESVFCSKGAEERQIKFANGTLMNDALSWWNAHAQLMGMSKPNNHLD